MNLEPTQRNIGRRKRPFPPQLLLTPILLLAFALRLHRIGERAVWWDEGWSVWVARQPLASILYQTGHDVHPPLYFWLLHLWRAASGDSEFGLRMLSAVFGTLTIAAIYLLGRAIGGRNVGLLAALFLALSRFHIVWSQEIRMYALAGLLAVLGAWAARRVWERGQWRDYALYVGSMTAGLLTLYLFFPIPLAANLAWLWQWRRAADRRALLNWAAAQIVILALVGAWLSYALRGFLTTSSATPIAVWDFLQIYWTVLVTGIPLDVAVYAKWTLPVLAVFVTAVLTLLLAARQEWRVGRDLTLLLAGLLIPIGVVIYVTIPKAGAYAPPFDPRYLVIFTGYYALLLAWGLARLGSGRRWPLALALSGVVLAVSLLGLRGYHAGRILRDDYKALAHTLRAYAGPTDAVVLYSDPDWPIFAYHYPGDWSGVPHLWQVTPETAVSYLTPLWENSSGLWLVGTPYAQATDPQRAMPDWLAERATAVTSYEYGDKLLRFYARTPERAASIQRVADGAAPQFPTFSVVKNGMHLLGYDLPSRTYRSGDTIHLALYYYRNWRVAADSHSMEISLTDQTGRAWEYTLVRLVPEDLASDEGIIRKEVAFTVPPDAPSGPYKFCLLNCGGEMIHFGHLTVRQRNLAFLTPEDVTISQPQAAQFANGLRLLGYDLATDRATPGQPLPLTLYWQTDEPITTQYKVFTHLMGETFNAESENFLWGQQDNEPVGNTRPTPSWRPGEVIVDSYAIPVAAHAPAGSYQLVVGLYNPVTGERLGLLAGGDSVVLGTAVAVQR